MQTAVNNSFQIPIMDSQVSMNALKEFDTLVSLLINNGIDVTVVEDKVGSPDAVFPNNWISFHTDGNIYLYPMFAENRRVERNQAIIDIMEKKFIVNKIIDLSSFELENSFLEGTGSMVLDRDHRIAYACLSPRTSLKAFNIFCELTHYTPIPFRSLGIDEKAVYHTNVMMCLAEQYAVICLDSMTDPLEKKMVKEQLLLSGKIIIEISLYQLTQFAGNLLQVNKSTGEKILVMSTQAYQSFTQQQLKQLTAFNTIIHTPLKTIETHGGGSARCMMAEVFLPLK